MGWLITYLVCVVVMIIIAIRANDCSPLMMVGVIFAPVTLIALLCVYVSSSIEEKRHEDAEENRE